MVNILEAQQQENKELLNEIETLKKLLADKDQAIDELKERFNENIILTQEEIREILDSFLPNIDERYVGEIHDYFRYRSHELEQLSLTNKNFRRSFVLRIYLHKHSLYSWIDLDKEVKNLRIKENELIESNNQLKEKNTILEKNIANLEVEQKNLETAVELERKNHLEFVDVSEVWHNRKVSEITEKKNADLAEARRRVRELEDILLVKNSQIKNLKESKSWKTYKFKQAFSKISWAKTRFQEKFQAFIVQKEK